MAIQLRNISGSDIDINNLTINGPDFPNASDGVHVNGVTIDYELSLTPSEVYNNQDIEALVKDGSLVFVSTVLGELTSIQSPIYWDLGPSAWARDSASEALLELATSSSQTQAVNVLTASSLVDQEPAGEEIPMLISFGSAQSNSSIDLTAAGEITFLKRGDYFLNIVQNVDRDTNTGNGTVYSYVTMEVPQFPGIQVYTGDTIVVVLNNANADVPIDVSRHFHVTEQNTGMILRFYFERELAGQNVGRLRTRTPSRNFPVGAVPPLTQIPSAGIEIYKLN